jgi:serine-type D-Ala-D-Ala endopeptidase (penicillin-binding protein 7)
MQAQRTAQERGTGVATSRAIILLLILTMAGAASAGETSLAARKGNPDLHSASALVLDAQGNLIYGKDVHAVRPIASITKLMTAMVVLDAGLDLDEYITVTDDDRDGIRMSGSRLRPGASLPRREMLLLALMSSENRAAAALGRTCPGGREGFVARMNEKAASLGMSNSHFADPAGLNVTNVSTASDLAKMLAAAKGYPLITQSTTTTRMDVHPYTNRPPLTYINTNRLLESEDWDIALSKTGYINEAGHCLVMRATIRGEDVSIVLLNSFGKLTPFGDSNRLRRWLLAES